MIFWKELFHKHTSINAKSAGILPIYTVEKQIQRICLLTVRIKGNCWETANRKLHWEKAGNIDKWKKKEGYAILSTFLQQGNNKVIVDKNVTIFFVFVFVDMWCFKKVGLMYKSKFRDKFSWINVIMGDELHL